MHQQSIIPGIVVDARVGTEHWYNSALARLGEFRIVSIGIDLVLLHLSNECLMVLLSAQLLVEREVA